MKHLLQDPPQEVPTAFTISTRIPDPGESNRKMMPSVLNHAVEPPWRRAHAFMGILTSTVTDARALRQRAYCSVELLHADCTRQSLTHVPCGYVPIAALSCYMATILHSHLHSHPVVARPLQPGAAVADCAPRSLMHPRCGGVPATAQSRYR